MNDLLWNLFKTTGDMKYYLFLKKLESCKSYENRESFGNNNK